MNRIIVPYGANLKLQKAFGKSLPTIRKALRGQLNDKTSLKIREAALKVYEGVEKL